MDLASYWAAFSSRPDFWGVVTIPAIAALVTWVHVWMAMKLVFHPVNFVGIPPYLGWQGVVPRRAGKIAGVLVDKTLSKLGSIESIFHDMEPEKIAGHLSKSVKDRIEEMTDEIMMERNPVLWENLPLVVKRRVYTRVRKGIPEAMDILLETMTKEIHTLIDVRVMAVKLIEGDRSLLVRILLATGQRELAFIVNVSFFIGLFFGILQMGLWLVWPVEWTLPIFAAVLGMATNWLALNMVFRPLNPTRIGPFTFQGLFLRRQNEVADSFASFVSRELLTVGNIMREVLTGPNAGRTHLLIKRALSPMVDSVPVRTAVQLTLGPTAYAGLRGSLANRAVLYSLEPLSDLAFNRDRAVVLEKIFSERIRAFSPDEFQDLLRPAFQEDEWMFVVLGAVTGLIAGTVQLVLGFH